MGSGFRLGRFLGIEVRIDWSLAIIFFLITFSLAAGLFPAWHPDWSAGLAWATALGAAVLFFVSVLAHEFSHALVGRRYGIDIRRITLFIFGGMAHLEEEPPSWRAELWMALIGPVTSFVIGVVCLWLAGAASGGVQLDPENPQQALAALGPVASLLLWLGQINILLALFNLVPGFPLDGGRALRAVMWGITGDLQRATQRASQAGQLFAWLLIGAGFAMMLGITVPIFGTGLVGGLWLAFIGWFLNNAALMSYRQLLVRESLENTPVAKLMQTRLSRVEPNLSLSALVDEYLMSSGQRTFPVERDGRLVGLLSVSDLNRVSREQWDQTTVEAIMTPDAELITIGPEDDAVDAMNKLGSRNVNQLPVVENDRLVGLLRREDVIKWLSLHRRQKPGREDLPV